MALAIRNGQIVNQTFYERICHFFNSSYHLAEVSAVIRHLQTTPSLELSNRLITHYSKDSCLKKNLTAFDWQIARLRPQFTFLHPENVKLFEKWNKANLKKEIFATHFAFAKFLIEANLVDQIKTSKNQAVKMEDGQIEPSILVKGRWMGEKEFLDSFEVAFSSDYNQKFLVDKRTRQVYTYLDNGLGVQQYHPYLSDPVPVSRLSDSELAQLRQKANLFARAEEITLTENQREAKNQGRPFILQVVNCTQRTLNTNFHQTFLHAKHVFIRLIAETDDPTRKISKGDVFEFGLERARPYDFPLGNVPARLRSPDIFEYSSSYDKIVTNIPISKIEAERCLDFCLHYRNEDVQLGRKISFNIAAQNCSVFTREACKAAGIALPTEMTIPEIIHSVAPDWIQALGQFLKQCKEAILKFLEKPLSKKVISWLREGENAITNASSKVFQVISSAVLSPVRVLLGDAFGSAGVAIRQKKEPKQMFFPPLHDLHNFFDFRIHNSSCIRDWQMQTQKAATTVFHHPIKLAI